VTYAAGPARDYYLAASDRYVMVSGQLGETTINSYAFAGRERGAEIALQSAVNALKSFGARFGTYPYTEFDVASTPMSALGIEYPGIVGIALVLYDPSAEVAGMPSEVLLESVVAHEAAHQWFYNVVGNDQIDEPWLDEAVVTFSTGLYYRDTYGPSAEESYRSSVYGRWDRVDRAEIPIGLPAEAYQGLEYGAIVYGRGAIFVDALEAEMGQEAFDSFMRDYYQAHLWGISTGEDFRRQAESHCQCDLGPMFEEWIYP
jgi:aminopeptidase N